MLHPCVRPSTSLATSVLRLALFALGLACGASDAEESPPPPASSGAAGTSSGPAPSTEPSAPAGPSAEEIAALTEMLGMAADRIQAACGDTFDACGATPGCDEILTCAAFNACSGADCYCLGEGCAMDGPCRSVIDSAPGARVPTADNPSLGPASDAASAVGDCLQGLGGGGGLSTQPSPSQPSPSQPSTPATGADAGAGAPDAG